MSAVTVANEFWFADAGAFLAAVALGLVLRRWYDAIVATLALAVAAPLTALGIRLASGGPLDAWLHQAFAVREGWFWAQRGTSIALVAGAMLAAYGLRALITYAGAGRALTLVAATAFAAVAVSYALCRDGPPADGPTRTADVVMLVTANISRADGNSGSRCFTSPAAPIDIAPPGPDVPTESGRILKAVPPQFADVPLLETVPDGFRGDDRLLTPAEPIRSGNLAAYGDNNLVTLTVVVGTEGQVLAAVPLEGPQAEYAAAVAIANRWRFAPYLFEGKPIAVRLERMHVLIGPPSRIPTRHAGFPTNGDRTSTFVRLAQRTADGRIDSYAVTIRGDGAVRYEGFLGVALTGEHCAHIGPDAADRVVAAFRDADFFSLDDRYIGPSGSLSSIASAVAISIGGRTKAVVEMDGTRAGMPASVIRLQNLIDDSVDVRRWTGGNERTIPSLRAEGWSFSRISGFDRTMLEGIAKHGTAHAVAGLLKFGVPPGEELRRALYHAIQRRDFDMIRALLTSNIPWPPEELNAALVETAEMGSHEFVTLLLRRGADRHTVQLNQTALMAAATSGVPDVVAALLAAGVDVKPRDNLKGGTALHYAAPFSLAPSTPEVRFEATRANRGKVVRMLVQAGASIEARDSWLRTPLNHNHRGYADVTAALIELGADVNTQDSEGRTPLMTTDSARATEMLLAAGANPFLPDLNGSTAFDWREEHTARMETTAVRAALDRWVATHPAEAERLREQAKRIGTSRVPKRDEKENGPRITPVTDGFGVRSFELMILVCAAIVQMLLAYAMTRAVSVNIGRAE